MIVSREVAATTPPSRPPRSWNGEGEVLGVVPLLRAEGSEEESQVGLVVPEEDSQFKKNGNGENLK